MKNILIVFLGITLSLSVLGQKQKTGGGGNTQGGGKTIDPNNSVTNVHIVYNGDQWGCSLPITVMIGNRSFQPQGTSAVLTGVPLGNQKYVVQGSISCPGLGYCEAYGEGIIYVQPNSSFFVVWQNTGQAQCSIGLSTQ